MDATYSPYTNDVMEPYPDWDTDIEGIELPESDTPPIAMMCSVSFVPIASMSSQLFVFVKW
jgi:hypothetical protein